MQIQGEEEFCPHNEGKLAIRYRYCLFPIAGKKGFQTSLYLQEVACFVAQSVLFDEGSAILAKLGHISLTDTQIERTGHHYGEKLETEYVKEKEVKMKYLYSLYTTNFSRKYVRLR